MTYASFYKRIKVLPGVYLNLSKQGVSIGLGPTGAKLQVPVYNASVQRTPQVRVQKSILGVRLQYRRSLRSLESTLDDRDTADGYKGGRNG